MKLSYWVLTVALVLSTIAAYYSILGLVTIFSLAAVPVIVMATAMEVSKVTISVWLHRYWSQASWPMKLYLVPAVGVLMLITSLGITGLLSKAHSGQAAANGDISARVAIFDEKIQTEKENIDASRAALSQMNASVDQTLARSTSEGGASRAVQVRKSQAKERANLQSDISRAQDRITKLQEERAPIAAQLRHAEAEVGPIRYVAAMVYGDNPDTARLERAVRWVIILLVSVFDPLAIFMVLASQQSLRWERGQTASTQPAADPLSRHIIQDDLMHTEMVERLDTIEDQVENMADLLAEDVATLTNYVAHLEEKDRGSSHSQGLPIQIQEDAPVTVEPEVTVEPAADVHKPVDYADDHYNAEQLAQLERIWESMHPGFTVDEHRDLYRLGLIDYLPWTERSFADAALGGEYKHLVEKN